MLRTTLKSLQRFQDPNLKVEALECELIRQPLILLSQVVPGRQKTVTVLKSFLSLYPYYGIVSETLQLWPNNSFILKKWKSSNGLR